MTNLQTIETGRLRSCQENVSGSFTVVRAALGEFSKQTAYILGKVFGKRATTRYVLSQGEQQTTARANFHEHYKRMIAAFFFAGNIAGAELLLADLEIFLKEVKEILGIARPSQIDRETLLDLIIIRKKLDLILAV